MAEDNRLFYIGERVRIHPASDWFMRGVTHGIITSFRKVDTRPMIYYVRPDTAGLRVRKSLRMKLSRHYVEHID